MGSVLDGRYHEPIRSFKIPTPAMLTKLIDGINGLELGDADTKEDLYEYLLSKVVTAGTNGQFRTPTHCDNKIWCLDRNGAECYYTYRKCYR